MTSQLFYNSDRVLKPRQSRTSTRDLPYVVMVFQKI